MIGKSLQNSALLSIVSDILADLSRLLQQEVHLAKAEIFHQIEQRVRGGVWLGIAVVLGLFALLAMTEAAVFALWSAGIPAYWASLAVAFALGLAALAAFFYGRSQNTAELTPRRSLASLSEDIKTVKERLS